ncbi:hypothetical protein ES702_07848 [subsurface metagenome]
MMEAIEGIQYPYALDKGGSIVKAVDAPRSEIYYCINCGERMVLRRGEIKQPHFAHYTENPNCAPETVLHKMAKDNISQGIDTALSLNFEYPLTWRCPICNQEHKGNLARSPREVETEVSLDGVRPDVLLSSVKGKPLVAIEVVVTHRPEKGAIEAYKRLKLPVIMVKPGWEDLEKLKSGLGLVKAWQAPCGAKRCPKCKKPIDEVEIGAFKGASCLYCGKPILVMGLMIDKRWDSRKLSPGAIKPARSVGVLLTPSKVASYAERTIVHVCSKCGALQIGKWHNIRYLVHTEVRREDLEKSKPYYRCEKCDTWLEKKRTVKSMTALQTLIPPDVEKGARNE